MENASRGLLAHLSLLFVPAGVGVVQKLDLIAEHGIAIIVILAISVIDDPAGDGGDLFAREPPHGARPEHAMSRKSALAVGISVAVAAALADR